MTKETPKTTGDVIATFDYWSKHKNKEIESADLQVIVNFLKTINTKLNKQEINDSIAFFSQESNRTNPRFWSEVNKLKMFLKNSELSRKP